MVADDDFLGGLDVTFANETAIFEGDSDDPNNTKGDEGDDDDNDDSGVNPNDDDNDDADSKKDENEDGDNDDDGLTPQGYIYELLSASGYADPLDKKAAKALSEEDLQRVISEDLPVNALAKYMDTFPEPVAKMLQYATTLENPDVKALEDFFNSIKEYSANEESKPDFSDTKIARAYLQKEYTANKVHSEDILESVLDTLEDKEKLTGEAEKLFEKSQETKKLAIDKAIADQKEADRKSKDAQKQFSAAVQKTITDLKWQDTRKQEVIKNLQSEVVQRKNALIKSSPMALVQLADIYSYFNEETKQFDFSKLIDVKARSASNETLKKKIEADAQTGMLGKVRMTSPNDKGNKKSALNEFE